MLNPNYHRPGTVRRGFNIWVAYLEFGPEQPAPVAVVLPERKTQEIRNWWNALKTTGTPVFTK